MSDGSKRCCAAVVLNRFQGWASEAFSLTERRAQGRGQPMGLSAECLLAGAGRNLGSLPMGPTLSMIAATTPEQVSTTRPAGLLGRDLDQARHRGLAPTLTLESHASRPRPLYESAGLRVRRLTERDKRCSPGAKRSHRLRDETSSRRPAVVEHHVGRDRLAVVRVLTSARLNTAIGSPTPRRGKLPHRCRRSRQLALVAKAAEKSALRSSSLLSVSSRAAMLTAGPITVKSSRFREPMFPYMTSP